MLVRRHHLRRSLFSLHRLSSGLLCLALTLLCARWILPYDNAIRLSVRFNAQKFLTLLLAPVRNDRWLVHEPPAFPLDWAGEDVGIILKTGYGTQERAVSWLEALPATPQFDKGIGTGIGMENVEGNVVVVGDFDGELHVLRDAQDLHQNDSFVIQVHDVVGEALLQCDLHHAEAVAQQQFLSSPRGAKYRNLGAAIVAGDDELARDSSRSFGWELDAMKFIPALDLAFRKMPNRKWYLLVDDDTYLIQPSLNLVLGHFDPDVPHYLGNAVGDYRQRFAHGGSAIVLSRAAMHKLFAPCNAQNLIQARRESLTEIWGDRLLARTLLRLGIYIEEGASRFFNGEPPWATRLRKDRFCVPVTGFHRLSSPDDMREVSKVFRQTDEAVLWADLWDMYSAPAFDRYRETPLRQAWDHVGALDEQTRTADGVKSAGRCRSLCRSWRECLAWTWVASEAACHMSPWVTVGRRAQGKVSGLDVERTLKLAAMC